MNTPTIAKMLTLLTASSILLTGCSTGSEKTSSNEESVKLSTSYPIEKVPDWDPSSITLLIEAGWNVEQMENMQPINEGFTEPVNYYATSENNKCTVSYFTFANIADETLKTDDQYLTYSNPNINTIVQNPSAQISSMNNNSSIQDASTGKEIQILTTSYTQDATDGIHQTENTATGMRTFSTPVANPYAILEEQSPNASINPTISVTYTCKDEKLDKELWETILKTAVINS